jgi:hypothetical protein
LIAGDVELQLDLLTDQDAAALDGDVPAQAPVLAVDGGLALEARRGCCPNGSGEEPW